MTDRLPLLDLDRTAAVEAATIAIHDQLCTPGCRESLTTMAAAKAVEAVWLVLGPVAYAQGQADILEGSTEEWGVRYPHGVDRVSTRNSAERIARDARTALNIDAHPEHRYVTAWRPLDP